MGHPAAAEDELPPPWFGRRMPIPVHEHDTLSRGWCGMSSITKTWPVLKKVAHLNNYSLESWSLMVAKNSIKKTKPVKSLCEYQAITSLVPFYPQVLHLNCQMYYRSWSKRSSPFDSMAPGPKFIGAWWVKHPSEVEDVFSFTPFFVITRMDVLKNTSGILWLYSISVFQFPRVMFFSMTCKQLLPAHLSMSCSVAIGLP